MYSLLEDEPLWQSFKQGDGEAFAEMYQRYAKPLYCYGYKVTSDAQLVEDSIQDLFIYLWKNRLGLGDTTSIKFYLFKSLRRELTRKLQGETHHAFTFTPEDDFHPVSVFSHEAYLIEMQTEAERVSALKQALEKLTKRQREAITLRFYENFSYQEIGGIMSLNYQSVCNLVYRSLHVLKDNIALLLKSALLLFLL